MQNDKARIELVAEKILTKALMSKQNIKLRANWEEQHKLQVN
jgi:hypothetical protein